jgi:hypothetical protein
MRRSTPRRTGTSFRICSSSRRLAKDSNVSLRQEEILELAVNRSVQLCLPAAILLPVVGAGFSAGRFAPAFAELVKSVTHHVLYALSTEAISRAKR